jgi:hypothetical protein
MTQRGHRNKTDRGSETHVARETGRGGEGEQQSTAKSAVQNTKSGIWGMQMLSTDENNANARKYTQTTSRATIRTMVREEKKSRRTRASGRG